ncbi:YciI family protein [Streptomyces sp. NPDC057072]|uniref:YciI family protein n=1 Tax=Streptomyces sp. NPDC057072 TaxID=3346014 RepID=UPI003624D7B8
MRDDGIDHLVRQSAPSDHVPGRFGLLAQQPDQDLGRRRRIPRDRGNGLAVIVISTHGAPPLCSPTALAGPQIVGLPRVRGQRRRSSSTASATAGALAQVMPGLPAGLLICRHNDEFGHGRESELVSIGYERMEGPVVAKFVTIGYGDQDGYDRTDTAVRNQAHAHDARLLEAGTVVGIAGAPVQVRNHDGAGTTVESGSFLSSTLPVAGFAIIEAETLEEAVHLASKTPCAVAQGVVEIWPLHELP